MESEPAISFENLDQSTVWDDLAWPFRKYDKVNDFIARDGYAATIIGFSGLVLSNIGLAPGVAAAVGVLGFATAITRLILMIGLNSKTPLEEIGLRGAGVSTVLYMSVAFGLYLVIGPGDIANITASIFQFFIGILITYIAGFSYMRLYKYLSYERPRVRYSVPAIFALLVVVVTVQFIPETLSVAGLEDVAQLVRVENQTGV